MPSVLTDSIVEWKSNRLSNEKIKPPTAANNSFSTKMRWINNSKLRVELKGSCLKQVKVTFTTKNVVNLFIVYELDTWSWDLNTDFTLKDCLELSS